MAEVKRICDLCKSDRTPHGEGIAIVKDFRGNGFAMIGSCCANETTRMLNKLAVKYGGYVDENGQLQASPRGTPAIRDFDHLRKEIGEAG